LFDKVDLPVLIPDKILESQKILAKKNTPMNKKLKKGEATAVLTDEDASASKLAGSGAASVKSKAKKLPLLKGGLASMIMQSPRPVLSQA